MPEEEKIRALCQHLLAAEDQDHFSAALADLKVALRDSDSKSQDFALKMMLEAASKPQSNGILRPITQKQFEIAAERFKQNRSHLQGQ